KVYSPQFGSYGPTNRIPGERCMLWLPLIPKARTCPLLDATARGASAGAAPTRDVASGIGNTTLAHRGQASACTQQALRGESSPCFNRLRARWIARALINRGTLSRVDGLRVEALHRRHRYRELRQRAVGGRAVRGSRCAPRPGSTPGRAVIHSAPPL